MRVLDRVLDLLEVAVDHLGGIRSSLEHQPVRGLGAGDVLSLTEAAGALHVRESDGIAWLRAQGLVQTIRLPGGRVVERVSWRRVLDVLESGEAPAVVTLAPPRAHPRRARSL